MTTTTSLITFADEIQRLSYELVHYYAICDRVSVESLEVTASQGYILMALPETDRITMNNLSIKMKLANSTMTRMVDQLVQKGMVLREPDPEDRRVVCIRITERGRDARDRLRDTLQTLFAQVIQDIPEEERASILNSLELLNRSILKMLKSCCGSELNV